MAQRYDPIDERSAALPDRGRAAAIVTGKGFEPGGQANTSPWPESVHVMNIFPAFDQGGHCGGQRVYGPVTR
jgi:hypothetical protein